MVNDNVPQGAKTALEDKQLLAQATESLHQHAMSILDELNEEQGKVYSVASAGRAYVNERHSVADDLFSVIETLCVETSLTKRLRELVAELAERAGSTWVEKVAA